MVLRETWDIESSLDLLDVLEDLGPLYKMTDWDWQEVSAKLGKSIHECKSWFNFIMNVGAAIPVEDRKHHRPRKKRRRRKASEITRKFKCQVPQCSKAYGTEGALKFHMSNKHKDVDYVPSYLYPYAKQPGSMINVLN